MDDEARQQLFGLMATALEHQKAVQAALEGLEKERANLAQERADLHQTIGQWTHADERMRKNVGEAIPDVLQATRKAVGDGVTQSLPAVSQEATRSLNEAATPLIDRIFETTRAADAAQAQLVRAGRWFAWKWVAMAAGGLAGVCLVAYGTLIWQVRQAETRVDSLQAEKVQQEANVADLARRGGRLKLEMCESKPKPRMCVRIDKSAGIFGKDGEERAVLWGY